MVNTTVGMDTPPGRRKRIVLIVLGALIVFLIAGPPEFDASMVVTGWTSDLDGGIHKLHIVMRGASAALVAASGLILILKPAWSLGVAQTILSKGAAFIIAGAVGQFFWPPVIIYPAFGIIITAVVLWSYRGQLPWQQPGESQPSVSKPMLVAAAIIAVPLIPYGLDQASLQRTSEVLHGDLGHWAGGTAVSLMIIFTMLAGALRMPGWRVPAWTGGLTLFMLGLASAAMPNQASSIGVGWGIVAMAAAFGFVALAEYENRTAPAAATTPPAQPARS